MKKPKVISLIVPVLNEEETIGPFLEVMLPFMAKLEYQTQFIFVDDGSEDKTLEILNNEAKKNTSIEVLSFSRCFGKEEAMTAGIDFAQGDSVIIMDVDLQDPPELINDFIQKWEEGYDIVYGSRVDRSQEAFFKRITALGFYKLFNFLSNTRIPINAGDYRLLDRKVIEALKKLKERKRFMKGLYHWVGFSSIGVPYARSKRIAGTTKWGGWKLWKYAIAGLFEFSTIPLTLWVYIGSTIAFLAFSYATYIISKVLYYGIDVPGYASLLCAILFMGGIQILSIGVIGQYIGSLVQESKQRPIYILKQNTLDHTK